MTCKGFSKTIGEEWLFCAEVRSLLSKLIFTHIASCWSRSHEKMEKQNTRLSPDTEWKTRLPQTLVYWIWYPEFGPNLIKKWYKKHQEMCLNFLWQTFNLRQVPDTKRLNYRPYISAYLQFWLFYIHHTGGLSGVTKSTVMGYPNNL